jgi:hypothetical protein
MLNVECGMFSMNLPRFTGTVSRSEKPVPRSQDQATPESGFSEKLLTKFLAWQIPESAYKEGVL